MNADLTIRPLSPEDYEPWSTLWKRYQDFYNVNIPEATTRLTFDRLLDSACPMNAALASQQGVAVGIVHWIYHFSTWTSGDYCYLQDLYVDSNTRGSGVGRALIEHVYTEAKSHGASRVYWLTQESNATAIRLYERVAERSGFVQYRKLLA